MLFKQILPDKDDLLRQMDVLGDSARIKKISILGRDYGNSNEFHELLLSLISCGAYEARLALYGAIAAKDAVIIKLGLNHRMSSIRKQATGLFAKIGSNEEIVNEIVSLSQECRKYLLRIIVQKRRSVLAEQLISGVYAKWGAKEAAILLPACGDEVIEKYIQEIGHVIESWNPIANQNMNLVVNYFQKCLEDASINQRCYVWWQFSDAMQQMCDERPELILACASNLELKNQIPPLVKRYMGILVRRCPEQVYRYLTRMELKNELLSKGLPNALLVHIKYLSMEQWIKVGKLVAEKPEHIAKLLSYLPPSNRGMVFEAIYDQSIRVNMVFPDALLCVLPHHLRDQEAARMIALSPIQESKESRNRITSYLDIDHARENLQLAACSSNAEERAQALRYLIRSTALSRHGMGETLTFLCRIKNDQDPVRSAVFEELAQYHTTLFTTDNIKELSVLVDSVIEARDTSSSTRYSVQLLACKIMIQNASNPNGKLFQYALRMTRKVTKLTGNLALPSLVHNIPHGLERNIFDEIYPIVANANQIERYQMVISLATALGKRGYEINKLQLLLQDAIMAKPDYYSVQIVNHWLANPRTRDERIKQLLAKDPSFIKLSVVFQHLHQKRQEWLNPFLIGKTIQGKFLTGKTIYLIPATQGFQRWLPRQQYEFAVLLERIINDTSRNQWERVNCIKIIARMPDVDAKKVIRYIESSEVAITEGALYATSLLQEPENSIATLLKNLEGDRARVAMYAIPRCARKVQSELLTAKLKELLNREHLKITVKKEAIRLLGVYKGKDCVAILQRELHKENPHKDVLIAVGFAARQMLENENAWNILEELVSFPQNDVMQSILNQQPGQLQARYRSRYLQLILTIAKHPEADVRKEAFTYMRKWIKNHEITVAKVAAAAIMDVSCRLVWNTALDTLMEACIEGKANEIMLQLIRDLVSEVLKREYIATSQRDLPQRQRLIEVITKLTLLPASIRLPLNSLYCDIVSILFKEPTLIAAALNMYITSIDWNQQEPCIRAFQAIADCIGGNFYLLPNIYEELLRNLNDNKGYWEPDYLLQIVDCIWNEGEDVTAYMALALLEVSGRMLFWRPDCIERINKYRNHENNMICSRALNLWTVEE